MNRILKKHNIDIDQQNSKFRCQSSQHHFYLDEHLVEETCFVERTRRFCVTNVRRMLDAGQRGDVELATDSVTQADEHKIFDAVWTEARLVQVEGHIEKCIVDHCQYDELVGRGARCQVANERIL